MGVPNDEEELFHCHEVSYLFKRSYGLPRAVFNNIFALSICLIVYLFCQVLQYNITVISVMTVICNRCNLDEIGKQLEVGSSVT